MFSFEAIAKRTWDIILVGVIFLIAVGALYPASREYLDHYISMLFGGALLFFILWIVISLLIPYVQRRL